MGSVCVGQPGASVPLALKACTCPLPSAMKAGELAPSASRYLGNPAARVGSVTEKNWRCPTASGAPEARTTTRTLKASFSGSSREVGSSAGE